MTDPVGIESKFDQRAELRDDQSTSSKTGRAAVRWGRLCCVVAAVALLLGEVAGGQWPVVLVTPYTPQCAAVAMIGVLLLAIATKRNVDRLCIVIGLAAFVYGGAIAAGRVPWRTIVPAQRVAATDANFGRIKVMMANVHTSNADHKTLLDVIAEEDPDVIVLPEVNDAWAADLRRLDAKYPIHTAMPDSIGNFGMAFWSRLPGEPIWSIMKEPDAFTEYDVPHVDATLTIKDPAGRAHAIRLIGLHPLPPIRPGNTRARDAVLTFVGKSVAETGEVPTIVAGDLNATRYCRIAQPLTVPGGLRDAAAPLRFSWPNTWSWWAMGIRIDHVLATDAWRVIDVHTGRDIHSDHLPIVATLQLVRPGGSVATTAYAR